MQTCRDVAVRGVPLRAEIGPRDVASQSVFLGRRDQSPKEKSGVPRDELVETIGRILDEMQTNLFQKALKAREENSVSLASLAGYAFSAPTVTVERPKSEAFATSFADRERIAAAPAPGMVGAGLVILWPISCCGSQPPTV